MSRKQGLGLVTGFWALLGAWTTLFLWPVYAGIVWLVALFLLMVYAALFVWTDEGVE